MNNLIYNIALILTIIGGLNWGLIGLFGFDAVAFFSVLWSAPWSRIVYIFGLRLCRWYPFFRGLFR